jgi:hypothetical protein
MKLSDHDLRQIDTEYLERLSHAQLLHVSAQLLADLKAARDRANQTPDSSSRPPGSFVPWEKGAGGRRGVEPEGAPVPQEEEGATAAEPETSSAPPQSAAKPQKRRGKQPGSAVHGRSVTLPVYTESVCVETRTLSV